MLYTGGLGCLYSFPATDYIRVGSVAQWRQSSWGQTHPTGGLEAFRSSGKQEAQGLPSDVRSPMKAFNMLMQSHPSTPLPSAVTGMTPLALN